MNIALRIPDEVLDGPASRPFLLYQDRIRPVIEAGRADLDAMYARVMGRPEIDPVLLLGITQLQAFERVPDRQAVERCLFDVRWRLALGIPDDWKGLHASTLSHFRGRLIQHDRARWVLEAGLEAMRQAGYLGKRRAVRIDSTHVLADLSAMSRLECARETLRLTLLFLQEWGGPTAWEPWCERYCERTPSELRTASVERLKSALAQTGEDMRDVLARAEGLGEAVWEADPVRLLRRVFEEQFVCAAGQPPAQREAPPAGAVQNPHDPEAWWSTKRSLGKTGWVGYKLQVCETAPEEPCATGEPTSAVITAVVTQPAIASDQNSLQPVLAVQNATAEKQPDTVFADAGYINAPTLERAQTDGYELCGPVGAPPHSGTRFGSDAFRIDIPNRRAICPAEKGCCACSRITESGTGATYYYYAWAPADCAACSLADHCLSKRKTPAFRTLQVGEKHMLVQQRRLLCQSAEYRHRLCRRSGIEGTHSELKRGYGVRRCRYRGLAKTDLQMQCSAAACNLRRWATRLRWLARKNP